MTTTVTAKTRTLTNGTANDASVVEAEIGELYTNDQTVATAIDVQAALVATLNILVNNGTQQLRWNGTKGYFEYTLDSITYHPIPPILASDPSSPVEGDIWFNSTTHLLKYRDNSSSKIVATSADVATVTTAAAAAATKYACIAEVQTSGTEGGTFSKDAWRTRTLNTEISDSGSIVSISSNQFTLAAGTYRIRAMAPASEVDRHKAKLYNITDSADALIGTTGNQSTAENSNGFSFITGEITIAGTKVFEIQHYCLTTNGTFGAAASIPSTSEVYTVVEITKIG